MKFEFKSCSNILNFCTNLFCSVVPAASVVEVRSALIFHLNVFQQSIGAHTLTNSQSKILVFALNHSDPLREKWYYKD